MDVAKLIVFAWLTLTAGWAVSHLWRGMRRTVLFCLVIHWIFCGLPLAFDLVWGLPVYNFPLMARAAADSTTNIIYLIYIACIPIVLGFAGWSRASPDVPGQPGYLSPGSKAEAISTLMIASMLPLPFLLALAAPDPSLYQIYGFIADPRRSLSEDILTHHNAVVLACVLASISSVALIAPPRPLLPTLALTLPWALLAMFLLGKRYIVALYLAMLLQRFWDLGYLTRFRLMIALAVAGGLFTVFNLAYQVTVRSINPATSNPERVYAGIRADFGRDHMIKDSIYAELQGTPILEYRGQSLVSYATFFIPRKTWPEKPLTYGAYHISYARELPAQFHGWSMTTSIFDEAIANFSWLGMLIAPIFLGLLCRLSDLNRSYWLKSIGILVCIMFMAVHLTPFISLFLLWIGGSLWNNYRGFLSLRSGRKEMPTGL